MGHHTKYNPESWHLFYKEYKKDKFLEKLKKNKTENTLFSTFKAFNSFCNLGFPIGIKNTFTL
jgi:hypothetical protein